MSFPKSDRKRGGRLSAGAFTPERERMIAWQTWLLDNNVPQSTQNEIADARPDMEERLEYIETLCRHCHTEDECEKFDCYSMDV